MLLNRGGGFQIPTIELNHITHFGFNTEENVFLTHDISLNLLFRKTSLLDIYFVFGWMTMQSSVSDK